MMIGPSKALFMDEISTGLDSSTTFKVLSCLQQLADVLQYTILVSLLEPAPEIYELFDDVILMAEGKFVYHGPKSCILSFFESCGFKCPRRKGAAVFLQEVLSKKDQKQFWSLGDERYKFVTVDQFCERFNACHVGQNLFLELSKPYERSKVNNIALSYSIYSLSKWEVLKLCFARELLLIKRNAFIYRTKVIQEFVEEVLKTIELVEARNTLVGLPGANGLSTEQRKQLTIAVELVSNPCIIFLDEPTSGLDATAAAVVMCAVKNVADTGRTVSCTIHQPSIEVFEAFDELMLMKRGGELIYAGPLGHNSQRVIHYFQAIPGVPKIKDDYNPSTWMLEVTSVSMETKLGVDFAHLYRESSNYKDNDAMVKQPSIPPPGMDDLHFQTQFPQKSGEQLKACLWKQCLSYWRTPSYNLARIVYAALSCLLFGALYWQKGNIALINDTQGLFAILGSMYSTTLFIGILNCKSVMPFVSTERSVMYRERFAGMYSPWAYSFAQQIPMWWIWLYRISPTSWMLNLFFTSQFLCEDNKNVMVSGELKTIASYAKHYLGYHRDLLPVAAIMLAVFPVLFGIILAYNISKLNFQKR